MAPTLMVFSPLSPVSPYHETRVGMARAQMARIRTLTHVNDFNTLHNHSAAIFSDDKADLGVWAAVLGHDSNINRRGCSAHNVCA